MPSHNYSASIPPNVYRDTTLKITEIRVYCEIEAAGNGKKDMWAKTAVIADTLGISYIATRRAITSLEQKGYIYRWWEGSIRHIRVVLNETRVVLNETRGVVLNETSQTSPKQGPHEDYKEKTIKRSKETPLAPLRGKPALSFDFIDDMDWKALFKKWATNKKSPYKKQVGLEAGFSKLRNMTKNDIANARAIINESFANNWAGLFPLDDDQDGVDEEYEAMRRKRRLGEI